VPVEVTLTRRARGTLSVYPISSVAAFGIDAFFTDRFGGVSKAPYDSLNLASHVGDEPDLVEQNRRLVAWACGVAPDRLVTVRQVHSSDTLEVHEPVVDGEADALVSSTSDVALAILVADCVPVLLVDVESSRFGVVHAGWRGLHAGILASALARFDSPATVQAFLGPSISRDAYQVGPEVARHFVAVPGALRTDHDDRWLLDLRHVAMSQLSEIGLDDERIEFCTQATDGGATFFSDRARRPCGRFALVARRAS
jgi:YfiH family protein